MVVRQQCVAHVIDLAQRPIGLVRERALLGVQLQFFEQPGEVLGRKLRLLRQYFGGLLFSPVDQNAFQPANDDDGENNALILVGLELAAQALSGFPDVRCEIVELGLVER